MDWINAAAQGILLGGLYALFAVGLSLVFGTMRLTNLAHGDLTILPAYVALMLVGALNFNPFYSIPITMVIMFAFRGSVNVSPSGISSGSEMPACWTTEYQRMPPAASSIISPKSCTSHETTSAANRSGSRKSGQFWVRGRWSGCER